MSQLEEILKSENVSVVPVKEGEFLDYNGYFQKFYRNYPKIIDYHCFICNKNDLAEGKVIVHVKESNTEGSACFSFNAIKSGFHGRSNFPKGRAGLKMAFQARKNIMKETPISVIKEPGLNPYKKVEFHKNFGKIYPSSRPEWLLDACPAPTEEERKIVGEEKEDRAEMKKRKKESMKEMKSKIEVEAGD